MRKDLALGSTTLAVAAGYYAMAESIPQSLLADAVGPQKVPQVYAVLLAGLSLVLIVRSLLTGGPTRLRSLSASFGEASPEPKGRRREGPPLQVVGPGTSVRWQTAAMLVIGILYIVAVRWLGYAISLGCLIFATTSCQSGRIDRKALLIAVSGAIFFWLLFVVVLGVPQPRGLWPSLF